MVSEKLKYYLNKLRKQETGLMEIKVKYLKDIEKIQPLSIGDWIDLRSAIDITLDTGEYALIPLGIAMDIPVGYEAHIVPRSSTYKKWHIIQANGMGIIDNSYCGDDDEWCMPVIAICKTEIHKNDRICQFRIIDRQPMVAFKEVETLNHANRGGFGSTGSN